MMLFARLFCALLVVSTAACHAGEARNGTNKRPNVIYVLADDLGWGELGCYGQDKIRTPNIDRIARAGMRFTQHYSGSPVCAPSRCVLLTGRHTGHAIVRDNWENGGWGEHEPEGQFPLPEGTPTLARYLDDAGYATAAIGKWGLGGPGTSGEPGRQGFDHFFGYLCQRKAHNYYPTHLWRNDTKVELDNPYFKAHQKLEAGLGSPVEYAARYAAKDYAPALMLDEALTFVREHREEPFFLYYASPIPHVALQVPFEDLDDYPADWDEAPYLGEKSYLPHPSPRRGYAAMVSHLDREVGALLDLLDELGLADDTIVMFSSDNGPTFNGGTDSEFFDSTAGLRGLKTKVYEGGIRVPFLARWPGRIPAGTVSPHISGFQDVLPTVLELCGQPPVGDIDGISLAPALLRRGRQKDHVALYWEYAGQQAVRAGRWKGVRPNLREGDGTLFVYDLKGDPGETTDIAADQPEVVAMLLALMQNSRVPSGAFPFPALDG